MFLTNYLTKLLTFTPTTHETKFYVKLTFRESKRRRCNYCLATCSCIIAVITCAICYTLIDNAPVVFLKQAEV